MGNLAAKELPQQALTRKRTRGNGRPGHVWVERANYDLRCEGLDPLRTIRRYAEQHTDIVRGEKYLRKIWRTTEGAEFNTLHCRACGEEIERVRRGED